MPLELLDLFAVLVDDVWMSPPKFRNELEDVVHFKIVSQIGKDLISSERTISTVVAMLQIGTIFELLFYWKVEDISANCELAIDFLLCKTESGYLA